MISDKYNIIYGIILIMLLALSSIFLNSCSLILRRVYIDPIFRENTDSMAVDFHNNYFDRHITFGEYKTSFIAPAVTQNNTKSSGLTQIIHKEMQIRFSLLGKDNEISNVDLTYINEMSETNITKSIFIDKVNTDYCFGTMKINNSECSFSFFNPKSGKLSKVEANIVTCRNCSVELRKSSENGNGFYFIINGEPAGAVDILNQRVWIRHLLSKDVKFIVANIATALLILN